MQSQFATKFFGMSENTTHTFSILPARNLDKLLDIADLLGLEKKMEFLKRSLRGDDNAPF